MMLFMILGVLLMGLAFFGRHWVSAREFYRRNSAGAETFNSYTAMATTKFAESIVRLLAGLMAVIGLICFFVGFIKIMA